MQVRDGRGRFTKSIVSLNKRVDSSQREVAAFVGHKKLIGGGLLKLERVQVICPTCGEQVEAVAGDGQVKGYCAVARQYVNFTIGKVASRLTLSTVSRYHGSFSENLTQLVAS